MSGKRSARVKEKIRVTLLRNELVLLAWICKCIFK